MQNKYENKKRGPADESGALGIRGVTLGVLADRWWETSALRWPGIGLAVGRLLRGAGVANVHRGEAGLSHREILPTCSRVVGGQRTTALDQNGLWNSSVKKHTTPHKKSK